MTYRIKQRFTPKQPKYTPVVAGHMYTRHNHWIVDELPV